MITMHTPRLRLRDHIPSDLPSHHALFSDPEVMWYLPDLRTGTLEASRRNLLASMEGLCDPDRRTYFLRVERLADGDHVGEIGYTVEKRTPLGKHVGVGYFLRSAHQGRGYASEALLALMRFAFEENDVFRMTCGCLKENRASERVMQKCGMIQEAHFVRAQWHDGQAKDRVEYRLLREEWQARQGEAP